MSFVKIKTWLAALSLLTLVACGGGGGSSADTGSLLLQPGKSTSGGTTQTVTLNVQLLRDGAAVTQLNPGEPVTVEALLVKNGQPVSDEIVQFSLVQPVDLAKIDPSSGSSLTKAGVATISLSSLGSAAGAGRVTATATVSGVQVTGYANFYANGSVGTQPATLSLGPLVFGASSVSAYGTNSVEIQVLQDGVPYKPGVTVSFTSSCPSGKATITPNSVTQSSNGRDGVAVATFTDNGCAQAAESGAEVLITASIGSTSVSKSMTVKSPTAGSLRFVSAVPSDKSITLRGQGGIGRQENAQLTFMLVDVAGQGVSNANVCFDATTYVGGLNLDGFSHPSPLPTQPPALDIDRLCGTDGLSKVRYVKRTGADGTVTIQINSGTVPTPVRVRARAIYPIGAVAALETYSDTLSISTGLPLQRSFSLSVDKANIEGGNIDGEQAILTVRLADQFSNPVPDNTVVNFVASGGAVCTSNSGACLTKNGICSCTFTSQERRPSDRRVVVTAYAVGQEDFDDKNGNNVFDTGDTFVDLSAVPPVNHDLGDAYVDANKDGKPGSGDPANPAYPATFSNPTVNGDTDILIPYRNGGSFQHRGDGVWRTAHIRRSAVIFLSQSSFIGDPTVVVPLDQLHQESNLISGVTPNSYFVRLRPVCPEGSPLPQSTISMVLDDGIGNPMAEGTTLTVADISSNISSPGFRPSSVAAFGAREPSPSLDLPNTPKQEVWSWNPLVGARGNIVSMHSVTVRGVENKCSTEGSFVLEVKSPKGGAKSARILYEGQTRSDGQGAFEVRYRDAVNFSFSLNQPTRTVVLQSASFVAAAGSAPASGYEIDWGDGSPVSSGSLPSIDPAHWRHTFLAQGNYTIYMTVIRNGQRYTASQFVSVP